LLPLLRIQSGTFSDCEFTVMSVFDSVFTAQSNHYYRTGSCCLEYV
jgi:hypothetical protein